MMWYTTRKLAVEVAKLGNKKIILLGGQDECSVCQSMRTLFDDANSKFHGLLECFVLWYGRIVMETHSYEWTEYVQGKKFSLPFIAIFDPNNMETPLDQSFGRQTEQNLYERLMKYSCIEEPPPAQPEAICLDTVSLMQEFQAGLAALQTGIPFQWCDGVLLKRSTMAGASVSFTDNSTKEVVPNLQGFSINDIIEKLYKIFPAIRASFDKKYPCSSGNNSEPEKDRLLAMTAAVADENARRVLQAVIGKLF